MTINHLADRCTQDAFAGLVGVTRSAIGHMIADDKMTKGDTAGEWLIQYCGALRAAAAGRDADCEDLTTERTIKTRVEREREEIKLELDRATYAPVAVLEQTLAAVGSSIVAALQPLTANIQRQCPNLSPEGIGIVRREVDRCCMAAEAAALQPVEVVEEEAPTHGDAFDD